jgi:phosphohistidine phosphatase
MQLLVARHGIAEPFGPDGSDASRRLTPEGIEKTRAAARGLVFLGPRPDVIFTSPRVRAAETARIIGQAFDIEPRVLKSLAEGSPAAVLQDLAANRRDTLCIVGHEPVLSRLIELACGASPGGFIEMKKAGCACLELTLSPHGMVHPARLLWLATPRMLRKLA